MFQEASPPTRRGFSAIGALARWSRHWLTLGLCAVVIWTALLLESRDAGLEVETLWIGDTPVTLKTQPGPAPRTLAVVAHGFGGSRQMMDQIAITLARSGFAVASFDFPGHGAHRAAMSPDVTRIEGTTAQLVETTLDVTQAMQARAETSDAVVFVGHSMATDVVIRAAQTLEAQGQKVAGVAAISMYSEAITATDPARLLIVSGAFETHLRGAGREALTLVQPSAEEGQTVQSEGVARRAVSVAGVGHVGVLYHDTTLQEVSLWLSEAVGLDAPAAPDRTGITAGLLLLALVVLGWPLAQFLPKSMGAADAAPVSRRGFALALAAPMLPALATAYLVPSALAPQAGILAITATLGVWGLVQLAVLRVHGLPLPKADLLAGAVLLAWGLGVFGLALDRYGAAFLPEGPRVQVMLTLLLGTLPLMLADAALAASAPLWRRVAARFALLALLAVAMGLRPTELGLSFTLLPVLLLFFLVYGSFARWVGARRGAGSPAWAMGIALAWAIAASTPLFEPISAAELSIAVTPEAPPVG